VEEQLLALEQLLHLLHLPTVAVPLLQTLDALLVEADADVEGGVRLGGEVKRWLLLVGAVGMNSIELVLPLYLQLPSHKALIFDVSLLLFGDCNLGFLELLLVEPEVDWLLMRGLRALLKGKPAGFIIDLGHRLDLRVEVLHLKSKLYWAQLTLLWTSGHRNHLLVRRGYELIPGLGRLVLVHEERRLVISPCLVLLLLLLNSICVVGSLVIGDCSSTVFLVILSLFSNHKRPGNIRVLLMLMIVLPLVTLILRAATFLHAAVTPSGFHFHHLLIVALFRLLPFFRLVSFVGGPGSAREDDLVDVGLNLRGKEVG
jgi:hypothetical protein